MTAKNSYAVVDRKTFESLAALRHAKDAVISVATAAAIAGMTGKTIIRKIHAGELPARVPANGRKGIRIRRVDFDAWLNPNFKTPTGDNREGQYNIGGSR